jgi:DNA-binding MarR family transcriptional regulator
VADDIATLFDNLVRVEIRLWDRADRRLRAEHGIPLTWLEPLRAVASGPRRVGEIAAALAITVGGASKLIDRLVEAGLLVRAPDPDDGRAAKVALTPMGDALQAAAAETLSSEVAAALDATLEQPELDTFGRALARLRAAEEPSAVDAPTIEEVKG